MENLNILNGESLKQFLIEKYNFNDENLIAFNECLIDGKVHRDIFSNDFFEARSHFLSEAYDVSSIEYFSKTSKELSPLLNNHFDSITLWFDFDMFCQINMLTILAYLEYTKFKGDVFINIISQDFHKFNSIDDMIDIKVKPSRLKNYYDLYEEVVVNKDFSNLNSIKYNKNFKELPCLKYGLELYSIYTSTNHEIKGFINEMADKDRYEILVELLNRFRNYGLGDLQFIRILNEIDIKVNN